MDTINYIAGALGTLVSSGAAAWIVQLSNRVTKIETKQEDLPELIEALIDSVNTRLDRIERSLNGHLIKE